MFTITQYLRYYFTFVINTSLMLAFRKYFGTVA